MKKTLLILTTVFSFLLVLCYLLLFTPLGNNVLKPVLETKINESSPIKIKLARFGLDMHSLHILIETDAQNTLLVTGDYSLFTQAFDLKYTLDLKDLTRLKTPSDHAFSGSLYSDGTLAGDLHHFTLKGKSPLAHSETAYVLNFDELSLHTAAIKSEHAKIDTLLTMLGEKAYAQGDIDLHLQLEDINPKQRKGSLVLNVDNARLNTQVLKESFALSIHKSAVNGKLKATLEGVNISYLGHIDSEILKMDSKGKIQTDNTALQCDYALNIKELALLNSLTNFPLQGPLHTKGTILGKDNTYTVSGKSDIADSASDYTLKLLELQPSSLKLTIRNAQLSKLLYLIDQPEYADANLDISVDLKDLKAFNGTAEIVAKKGRTHTATIKRSFDITMPKTTFSLKSDIGIKDNRLTANSRLDSNLMTLDMYQTRYDISQSALESPYTLSIPSLQALEPLLERKLYGKVKAKGNIRSDETLRITAHSDIFDGTWDVTLLNETVSADFKNLKSMKILKMLGYPEVMDAPLNGSLSYDTKLQKGKLDARFDNARLARSKMTDLLQAIIRKDLSKEHFNRGTLLSHINKEVIDSKLDMQSKELSVHSRKLIINSKKNRIDARLSLQHRKHPADVLIKGDINAPSVTLDAKSMLTPEIEEKAKKEIHRFLKKLF